MAMIPYGRQIISDADLKAVEAVLHSDYLTQGPAVPAFEQAVAARVGATHAVAVNSATSALHIACLALDLGRGDPWVDAEEALAEYGLELVEAPETGAYDGVLLAVAHHSYQEAGYAGLRDYGRPDHLFCDLKSVFARNESDLRL